MSGRPLWSGLALVDAKGRAVVWHGSDCPKLYRSDEQGRYARTDGAEFVDVTLILGRIEPKNDAPTRVAAAVMRAINGRRTYRAKECAEPGCGKVFTPTGPRARYCPRHNTVRSAS